MSMQTDQIASAEAVKARRLLRDEVLRWCYEDGESQTYPNKIWEVENVAQSLQAEPDAVAQAVIYLCDCELVETVANMRGGWGFTGFGLSVRGVEVAENIILPTKKIDSAIPNQNIIVVSSMVGSSIVQASSDVIVKQGDIEEAMRVVDFIRDHLSEHDLSTDDRRDIEAQLDTAEAQARARKPMPNLISAALIKVMSILDAAAAAVLLEQIRQHFPGMFPG